MRSISAMLVDELGYDPDDDRRDRRIDLAAFDGSRVPVGGIVAARDGARPVAIARLGSGRLVVVDDACPHDGGPISDGFVDGELLVCARHGWELRACGRRCVRDRER